MVMGEGADDVDEAPGDVGRCILNLDKLRRSAPRDARGLFYSHDRYSAEDEALIVKVSRGGGRGLVGYLYQSSAVVVEEDLVAFSAEAPLRRGGASWMREGERLQCKGSVYPTHNHHPHWPTMACISCHSLTTVKYGQGGFQATHASM